MQLVSCVNLQLGSGVPAEDYCKIHLKVSRFNESVDLVSAILYDNNVYKCAWTVADEEESEDTLSIQWIRFSQQRKIPVHRFFLFLYRERDTVSMDTFNCVDPDNIFIMIQSGKSLTEYEDRFHLDMARANAQLFFYHVNSEGVLVSRAFKCPWCPEGLENLSLPQIGRAHV